MRDAPYFDHHVHSVVSGDSTVSLEERTRTAKGPRPHGVSDHFPSPHLRDDDDVLRHVERAKVLGLRVALEYDIGVAPPLRPSTREALDYLVGGVHQLTIGGGVLSYDAAGAFVKGKESLFTERSAFEDGELQRVIREEILRILRSSFERDRVDVLAHPTFSPLAALGDPETYYPLDWQWRLIELCGRHRVAIEVNESYRLPHALLLRRARDAGLTFAVGSDSHAELLELDFTRAVLADAGIAGPLRDPRV